MSSGKKADDGGRGSELLLRRPACQLSSAVDCGGGGACDGTSFCAEGLRILIEELRSLCEVDSAGFATCAGACGTGVCVVVVIVGCVVVVVVVAVLGPKSWTLVVPCPDDEECTVVVPCGPWVVVVVVEVVSGPAGWSRLP